ncbi:MAG: tRNA uridine-5-carboxymethylaminomethyl(34) synthesis GTPase MnmE, partial [Pseudomonadota bacterium]
MEHSSNDTIIALSSGGLPSGVAVIRTSGPLVQKLLDASIGELPKARMGVLREVRDVQDLSVLDQGIVFWFPGPASYTGEDCAEFHVHGGKAVVDAILSSFLKIDGVRLAVAGEFSRR